MDESSTSLKGNDTRIRLQRRFAPSLNATANHTIEYGNALHHPHDGHMSILQTTGFEYKDDDGVLFTGYLDDDGYGKVRMYKLGSEGERVYVYQKEKAVGTIEYTTGKLTLKEFRPISYSNGADIRMNVKPNENNVFANRSRIITLDKNDPESIILTIDEMNDRAKGIGNSSY